jgi:hypothetical protein
MHTEKEEMISRTGRHALGKGSSGQPWSRPTPDLKIPCGIQDAQDGGGGFSELPKLLMARPSETHEAICGRRKEHAYSFCQRLTASQSVTNHFSADFMT